MERPGHASMSLPEQLVRQLWRDWVLLRGRECNAVAQTSEPPRCARVIVRSGKAGSNDKRTRRGPHEPLRPLHGAPDRK